MCAGLSVDARPVVTHFEPDIAARRAFEWRLETAGFDAAGALRSESFAIYWHEGCQNRDPLYFRILIATEDG
jgi:hypothetical protein